MPNVYSHNEVTTGVDGRFVFERMFPGKRRIGRHILLTVDQGATEITSSHHVMTEFPAGKTTTLELGGKGRAVIGKLKPPARHSETVHWSFATVDVRAEVPDPPAAPAAPDSVRDNPEKRKAWWEAWKVTAEGRAWEALKQAGADADYFTASVGRDGSFRIDDMPTGEFTLQVRFDRDAPGILRNHHFEVPNMEEPLVSEPLDLGTLQLQAP